MASEIRLKRQASFSDTDMAGIVHFSRFFCFMEDAEHEFFRSLGLSVHTSVNGRQVSWPRVACSFEYINPLLFEQEMDIGLYVERIGKKSITYRCEIFALGQKIAVGKSTSVCVEMHGQKPGKSISIPDIIRDKIDEAPKAQ